MASIFQRKKTWWVKLQHPITGKGIRKSLETHDIARADLLRRKIEIEAELREPRFLAVEIPAAIMHEFNYPNAESIATSSPNCSSAVSPEPLHLSSTPHTRVDDAVSTYLKFIESENSPHNVRNKVSILRRFLGSTRISNIIGTGDKAQRNKSARGAPLEDVLYKAN